MRSNPIFDARLFVVASAAERREIILRAELERAETRRREVDSQHSPFAAPEERIRIWERLHALRLPRAEGHPLLAVIATQTHLSVRDILDEQCRRRGQQPESSVADRAR